MSSTSATSKETVMSLRIKLKNIKPLVWRRILVPRDYTFKDLSVAIDSAMGWCGYPYHLYEYSLKYPRTYKKLEFGGHCIQIPITKPKVRKRSKIADIFTDSKVEVIYDYDLGSTWTHFIHWEKDVPALKGEKYPKCVGGRRQPPPEDDPGSDYSYSDVEQNFHHSKVDMSRCRQVIMGVPKKNKVTRKKFTNSNAKSSEVLDLKESNSLKKELTLETNVPTANKNMNSTGISDPSIGMHLGTMQDLPNDSSSSAAKTRLIASQISTAGSVIGDTISRSVQTVQDELDDSFSSSYTIEDELDYSSSSSYSIEDELDNSSSSCIQNHMKKETDQDVEDMYGKDIASQMRLVPNEVSQISAASTVIGDTISSPVATVQDELDNSSSSSFTIEDELDDSSSSSLQNHMKKETDQDVEDMYGKYIASQMRLVSDLEARDDMLRDIQSIIKKYRFQKK